jgi:hypothetical protein
VTDGSLNWIARTGIALAARVNPVTGGPAAPLKASALLDSFAPSLMPRKSLHQGVAGGLALLAGEMVGRGVDQLARSAAPDSSPLAWRIGARAAMAAAGSAIAGLSDSEDEPTSRAALRSAGRLTAVAAVGGIIFEVGRDLEGKVDWPLLPTVTGLGGFAFVASRLAKELETREGVIQRWTEDDKPAALPGSMGIAMAVALGGRFIGSGFISSRRSLAGYLGGEGGQAVLGRMLNLALWGAGATTLYGFVVSRLSRHNSKMETSFSTPPMFPAGLREISSDFLSENVALVGGWAIYLFMTGSLLMLRKRSIFYSIYAVLCCLLILNSIGCNAMNEGLTDIR